jgi:PAS domain S-box-containing protein
MARNESLSVLVVDDSEFFSNLLADKLESDYGMTTTTVTDATRAVSAVDYEAVDCVVSDYEMPGRSGLELYRAVEQHHDVPFILLTSEGDEEVASRAIRMGIDEYLLKKAVSEERSLDLLVNRIRNVVDQRRTQRKYEQLVDNSPDEISQVSLDGEILAANAAMATAFGTTQPELVGEQLSSFLPDPVANGRLEEARRAVTADCAVTFQDSIGIRHFHNIAVPLTTPGDGESVQLVTREMTLQKRNERELERKSEKLTLINRIVRHDINNDVQMLIGWADLLDEHVDEAGRDLVERIGERSSHIAELTAIARDFVESLEGDTTVDLEPVDVDRVLETEVEKRRSKLEGVTFEVDSEAGAVVRANELLSSVVGNLLGNAVRHNDAPDPEVRVEVRTRGTEVAIRVADNGPGVPDARKEEIFGKGTMGPESPGTGVGLYLVHTLVEQFGGGVRVEDNEPTGAVFVVELPKHPGPVGGCDERQRAGSGSSGVSLENT